MSLERALLLRKLRPELHGAGLFHSRANDRFAGKPIRSPNNATGQTRTTGVPACTTSTLTPDAALSKQHVDTARAAP